MSRDAQLLDRWRSGDAAAGEELLQRHFERLYLFFANKVDTDLDDLIQRTMLACVKARDRIADGDSFRAYLFSIARRELIARYRDRGRAPGFDASVSSVRDVAPSATAVLADRADQRQLLEALRSLPLDFQTALELHYWEELPVSELAVVFGVPLGTAKSRLRRAREALAAALQALASAGTPLPTTAAELDDWARSIRSELRARQRRS